MNANEPIPYLKWLLYLTAATHFAILFASALAPKALEWRKNLASLPQLLRQMFWVYGAFIVLVIVSFGTLILIFADRMAAGEPVARGLCAMIAVFWAARLCVQWFVFDAEPFLVNAFYRVGYHMLTVAFVFLTVVHGAVALGLGS